MSETAPEIAPLSTGGVRSGSTMRMMNRRMFLSGSAALLAAACGGARSSRTTLAPGAADAKAAELCKRAWVFDGNLVAPLDDEKPLPAEMVALVRKSGLSAFKQTLGGPVATYDDTKKEIAGFDAAIAMSGGLYQKIEKIGDFDAARAAGKIGLVYSFEAVEMLESKIDRIDEFSGLGVRVMQLSYNKQSPFAAGVLVPQPSAGLTELGRQAIARMNQRGVTVDLSHCDEPSSLAAVAASTRPVAITHAGCSAIHAHPRNKSDRLLRAVADKGGTVGIYELSFLSAGPAQQSLDEYIAHVTHAIDVCGEDHVGVGSDALLMPFDVTPENMAEWNKGIEERRALGVGAPEEGRPPFVVGLNRSDRYVVIASALLQRGYAEQTVEKILGGNFRRLLAATWLA